VVKFTLECVSILLDEKNDWDSIKRFLADPNFLSRMKTLNVYNINPKVQQKIKAKIASNPAFIPAEVQKVNFAAKSMCEWVRAVSEFTEVNKDIEKKKS
jgi:dynein heavy chain